MSSRPRKSLGSGAGVAGDHVTLIATDEHGIVKQIEVAGLSDFESSPKNVRFCSDCGERLAEIPLYMCETCGARYVARFEPKTGKIIIFALGKEQLKENQK